MRIYYFSPLSFPFSSTNLCLAWSSTTDNINHCKSWVLLNPIQVCLLISTRLNYYFVRPNLDFISERREVVVAYFDRCVCICLRWEELVFLIKLIVISAKHSVLVQNLNCRDLLCTASCNEDVIRHWKTQGISPTH